MVSDRDVVREYFEQTRRLHLTPRLRPQGPKSLKSAREYLAWCERENLDLPLGYLRFALEHCALKGFPANLRRLRSKRMAGSWREYAEGRYRQQKQGEDLTAETKDSAITSLQLLTRSMEVVKARYGASRDLCVAEIDISGGFDPRSAYCPTCPAAAKCAAALHAAHGFDVVSLRAGRLHFLPHRVRRAISA